MRDVGLIVVVDDQLAAAMRRDAGRQGDIHLVTVGLPPTR